MKSEIWSCFSAIPLLLHRSPTDILVRCGKEEAFHRPMSKSQSFYWPVPWAETCKSATHYHLPIFSHFFGQNILFESRFPSLRFVDAFPAVVDAAATGYRFRTGANLWAGPAGSKCSFPHSLYTVWACLPSSWTTERDFFIKLFLSTPHLQFRNLGNLWVQSWRYRRKKNSMKISPPYWFYFNF